jgi:hypothetical protein
MVTALCSTYVFKKSVYIETTIPSYATARTSRDPIKAGRQAETKLFWEKTRHNYNLYISQYVIDECADGDVDAAKRRLDFIEGIKSIQKTKEIEELAHIYQNLLGIPKGAEIDSFHLAVCVDTKIDYLLTWNFTHMGIETYKKLLAYNDNIGLQTPFLLSPGELNIKELP